MPPESRVAVALEAITPDNYAEALRLAVSAEQERWVAPITKSLADAFVWRSLPRVARHQGELVGFVLVFPYEIDGTPVANIVRFMIDHRHQRRGLGKALLSATLDWLACWDPRPRRLRISTLPDNRVAQRLYRSFGFSGDNLEGGELVLWRSLDP